MTTAIRITAAMFGALAGLLYHFDYHIVSLYFTIIGIILLFSSLITHRFETKKAAMSVDTPASTIDNDALIVSKLSHPDLRERAHRISVLGCTIFNKSGQRGAITKVNAYDKKNNLMHITWSSHIDDFGNPINPCELIGIIDKESLFIRGNDGKEIDFCKLEIFHSFSDSALTVTFDEYAGGWKL